MYGSYLSRDREGAKPSRSLTVPTRYFRSSMLTGSRRGRDSMPRSRLIRLQIRISESSGRNGSMRVTYL